MNILTESAMNEKSQPFDHSISCHLNYAQYFVLSDLTMQSLFNDDFQLLFRICWELWCELPPQIAFKHLSLFHIRKRKDGMTYSEREREGDQQVCTKPSSVENIL